VGVPNRLGMKDWIVLETLEDAHNMTVVAGKPVQPEVCPRCGVESPRVYKHDQQDQTNRAAGRWRGYYSTPPRKGGYCNLKRMAAR